MKKLFTGLATWLNSSVESFPNEWLGDVVAVDLLIRSLQLSLGELVYIKAAAQNNSAYEAYWGDARGDKAMFLATFVAAFTTSASSEVRSAIARLSIACESPKHVWRPNQCGSYICLDGKEYFIVNADFLSGNISIVAEGQGGHVPDDFRKNVSELPCDALKF